MLLLLTEPPDLEEKEEKEDVEDNPATKDLNARLASCWHPFDILVLLHTEREFRENEEEFLLKSEEFCVCFLYAFLFRVYNPNFKNCFSLSVEKKTKLLQSVLKGGASLFSSVFLINYIIDSIKRGARKKTFIA